MKMIQQNDQDDGELEDLQREVGYPGSTQKDQDATIDP